MCLLQTKPNRLTKKFLHSFHLRLYTFYRHSHYPLEREYWMERTKKTRDRWRFYCGHESLKNSIQSAVLPVIWWITLYSSLLHKIYLFWLNEVNLFLLDFSGISIYHEYFIFKSPLRVDSPHVFFNILKVKTDINHKSNYVCSKKSGHKKGQYEYVSTKSKWPETGSLKLSGGILSALTLCQFSSQILLIHFGSLPLTLSQDPKKCQYKCVPIKSKWSEPCS